ncbi:MAG: aspartate carbamoyltransferase [Spirochaetales bacterium]|nr:aspartate carbamoyltransferase [Spirochaetales bacterium]
MGGSFRGRFPLAGRDLLSTRDLSREEILLILDTARSMERLARSRGVAGVLSRKVVAVLFLEPSTRTRLSFEAAAQRLGARVVTVAEASSSSAAKGETLVDTARMLAGYADCIVMRQGETGGARRAADAVDVPVVNAGDGAGEHPTQALLDLYTIRRELGGLDGLSVAMVGDLKYGRTVHSLAYVLLPFRPSFVFCSPGELRFPPELVSDLQSRGAPVAETDSLALALKADVVYMTRLQRERFADPAAGERLKGAYVLTRALVEAHHPEALILHPLPRVDEIAVDVDDLPTAAYFRQAQNGMYVRMAILKLILGR